MKMNIIFIGHWTAVTLKNIVLGKLFLGQLLPTVCPRFGGYRHGGHWGFNDYNRWREQDGMLCRSSLDCTWMDQNMQCEDYELDFSPVRAWYGGDFAAIIGQCDCRGGMEWDNRELECQVPRFGGSLVTVLVIVLVLGVLGCCCCGFLCWFCRR